MDNMEIERKKRIVTWIFQASMLVLLIVGWVLIEYAGVDNQTVLWGFFSIFGLFLIVSLIIKKKMDKDNES